MTQSIRHIVLYLFLLPVLSFGQTDGVLFENIDQYDPVTGTFMGSEQNWYGPDGRRLRWIIKDARDSTQLLFVITHDAQGREKRAIYFEGDMTEPDQETFTYSDDGRTRTTTYYYEPGVPADRTESIRDVNGREVFKRYFRSNGTQYGEEDVLWNPDGTKQGWDFRYVEKEGGTSFRYNYLEVDNGRWIRRIRTRNAVPERIEIRTLKTIRDPDVLQTPVKFAMGIVSTARSETSPSFTADGKIMVFARYDDEWTQKDPYIAHLGDKGWIAERLDIGNVYNLAISPDGSEIYFSTRIDDIRTLYRVRKQGQVWSSPQNLTKEFGITGTYPCLTPGGTLYFFDHEGKDGAGIYRVERRDARFGTVESVFITEKGSAFDAFPLDGHTILVSHCFDDTCISGPENGIWRITHHDGKTVNRDKLIALPYAWGVQTVPSLGIVVFTDGEDILALPLPMAR